MGSGSIVIDGVTYHWVEKADPHAGSADFSWRGLDLPDTLEITGDDGTSVEYVVPTYDEGNEGWWRGRRYVTQAVIERAFAIARGKRAKLTSRDVSEALHGPWRRSLEDELNGATVALAAQSDDLLDCLLAIGCKNYQGEARVPIDDWTASHADELAGARDWLHGLLAKHASKQGTYADRSAIAFLIEMCERVNVDLGLDLTAIDARLTELGPADLRPWGIPPAHWWWRQGKTGDRDRFDPHDN